ncbi:MAG TPA: hypothetical protein DDY58_09375 [Terrisporobacter glycolicus]|uniref:Lipoprotein n=1 Tax=Terrisporobacter petrolearius TaxID=1460447 RepID=A0ABZ3FJH0_9FIRM|nr:MULTISPECIES: hypothetical protein [Terrisporobacter]MBN9647036.1 hypothetical protein [Terrisporobacter glycolicus]HBI92615.1 hypothetical protein [Terrisporobacter hibernicus]
MKNIGLLLSSITAFFIILGCLFYNSLLIDMNRIKDYVTESNVILQEVMENQGKVDDKKGEYISRLMKIKKGMENSHTSFLFDKYKVIKTSAIELLIDVISEDNEEDKEECLKLVFKANSESQDELNTLMNKNFIEVTYLCLKTYISI